METNTTLSTTSANINIPTQEKEQGGKRYLLGQTAKTMERGRGERNNGRDNRKKKGTTNQTRTTQQKINFLRKKKRPGNISQAGKLA